MSLALLIFFFSHWFLSLFFHTAFLHRYGSHGMYKMGPRTERVFYFLTWFFQGSSYLIPRAYAVMHRMHHEYSDTKQDPHSPHFFKDVFGMMIHTKRIYNDFVTGKRTPDSQFAANLPVWSGLDAFGDHRITRVAWGVLYSLVYFYFIFFHDASAFWLLLLPIHFLMGPIQGATVNWCGHKYGYSNYDNHDHSKNSEPWGIILMGELHQNNHHMYPKSLNFAQKWWEFDITYPVLKVLSWFGIIKIVDSNK